jgi:hypothetical protein
MSEQVDWRRARHCNGGNCVEVASIRGEVGVRDSKEPDGPVLMYHRDEFLIFLQGVKAGEFDDLVS